MSIDLEALQKLCDAATPGPWRTSLLDDFADQTTVEGPMFVSGNEVPHPEDEPEEFASVQRQIHADAAFIAAARTAVSELIQEMKRLREALNSIAASACCESCQEAALVAQKALR